MRDVYRSLLTALGGVLALWLILGFWPLSVGNRVALSLLVILPGGVMLWRQHRALQSQAQALRDIADESLPPEDFQGAVILVCGDNRALFADGTPHRETRQGWYLWVKDAEQLPLLALHLSQVRPALASQVSVMLAVLPEQHSSADDFTQCLRGWQRAVMQCRTALGRIPPVWSVTWVSPPAVCSGAEPVWFSTFSNRAGIQVHQPGQGKLSLAEWTQETAVDERFSRLSQGLWLDSVLAWQKTAVSSLLSVRQGELPALKFCVQGLCMVPVDDDLPELTEGLVSMLWPHYLRTIPSLSVVALSPSLHTMKMAEVVPAGLEVYSRPVGPKNTVCRYRTTQDVMLNPLSVSGVTMTTEPDGRSLLRMRFACSSQADWSHADLSRLSLYLGADAPVSSHLHLMLTKRQAALYMRLPGQTDRIRLDGYFSPGGFRDEDTLWPKGDSAFSGYQLLLEYFTFRDKFMFVHLHGLDGITPPAGAEYFDIDVVFSSPWPSDLPMTDDAVRLHCVPVINLFTLEADPLTITGLESEYLLRPKRLQDGHTEIYAVDSVIGSNRTNDAEYVPFSSFRHKGGMMRRHAPLRYYHTRVKRSVTGLYDTWLILGGHQWEDDRLLEREGDHAGYGLVATESRS